MGNTLNRDDYRKIKNYSKSEMEKWLDYHQNMLYNLLRKDFEKNYQDEIENSVSNFLIAVWYTLHFNEDVNLQHDELASFMDDLYVTVDMFRKGEYKPDDYKKALDEDGIKFVPFDYSKLYREKEGIYQKRNEETINLIKELIEKDDNKISGDLQIILNKLEEK